MRQSALVHMNCDTEERIKGLDSVSGALVNTCVCVCVCVCARACVCVCWGVVSCSVVSDCEPMDYSPSGSSVRGILLARILELLYW